MSLDAAICLILYKKKRKDVFTKDAFSCPVPVYLFLQDSTIVQALIELSNCMGQSASRSSGPLRLITLTLITHVIDILIQDNTRVFHLPLCNLRYQKATTTAIIIVISSIFTRCLPHVTFCQTNLRLACGRLT